MDTKWDESSAKHVLLVDDESGVRSLFTTILEREGWSVTCVTDGEQALKLVEEDSFDLVLLDILLRGRLDGFDVFDHLDARGLGKTVIFLTGRPSDERQQTYFAKAGGILNKPISGVQEIMEALWSVMSRCNG